jgi:hypothetical protein
MQRTIKAKFAGSSAGALSIFTDRAAKLSIDTYYYMQDPGLNFRSWILDPSRNREFDAETEKTLQFLSKARNLRDVTTQTNSLKLGVSTQTRERLPGNNSRSSAEVTLIGTSR